MIKPSILARKIIAQCPELNISEAQLTEDIKVIFDNYHPKPESSLLKRPYIVQEDVAHVLDSPTCEFCGESETTLYKGYMTDEGYLGFKACYNCGHWESF